MFQLHTLLDPAFARFADRVALIEGDRSMTYAELDAQANRVANHLLGVLADDEDQVGVSSAVTQATIVSILGVLRAGRAYVPLDVLAPPQRLRQIITDGGLRTAIIDPVAYPDGAQLQGEPLQRIIHPDAAAAGAPSRPRPTRPEILDGLAYVLYTSGSTGTPKGVMLTHRNAITFVAWMAKEFAIGPDDRVAARSPLNFDFSVFDIFTTLLGGATLIVIDQRRGTLEGMSPEQRHRAYVEAMRRERATVLYATPSAATVLLEKGGLDPGVPLRLFLYAGEPFHPEMLSRFMRAMPKTKVCNIYGPTETNIITYYWVETPPTEPVPIGREVDDTFIIVVDTDATPPRLCDVGEVGEVWCHGGTVCIGYLGKPELTAERYVWSRFHRFPLRFWRTGDIGKRLPDGNIAYFGRRDDMVKTRGYRVEIGDVEAALCRDDKVRQCVVVHRPHPKYGSSLHAFVLLADDRSATPEELLELLRQQLPAYMVPLDLRIVAS
ncbi:MAG TPA: amino acid adenylation domain-containing protein, partial [Myxococcota bacterium]|nr:amino acid adenylation domain-containing protein [Myxococcota bacterium]